MKTSNWSGNDWWNFIYLNVVISVIGLVVGIFGAIEIIPKIFGIIGCLVGLSSTLILGGIIAMILMGD